MRCPECGHQLHGFERMLTGLRAELEAERQRKAQQAAYRRMRYATDPAYRERQKARSRRWKARQATSTSSPAPDQKPAAARSSGRSRSKAA